MAGKTVVLRGLLNVQRLQTLEQRQERNFTYNIRALARNYLKYGLENKRVVDGYRSVVSDWMTIKRKRDELDRGLADFLALFPITNKQSYTRG